MSGPELEPCPFCGGEMQLWEFGTQVRHANDADGCPIRHLTLFRHCWNRRAPVTVPKALAALRSITLEALSEAEEGFCLPLSRLSIRTGLPRETLRGIIADLRAEGLASHHRGLMDESGVCAGSGYAITDAGLAELRTIREA